MAFVYHVGFDPVSGLSVLPEGLFVFLLLLLHFPHISALFHSALSLQYSVLRLQRGRVSNESGGVLFSFFLFFHSETDRFPA